MLDEPGLLFLIGYRGTGKTTVARLLAAKLGWDCVDADEVLESRFGRTIQEIFAAEGEAGFRDRESQVLDELCQRQRQVIATGGGVILRPANRERLHRAGTVIWLTADVDTICRRLQADATTASRRPALSVGGRAEVEELLRQREPLYREAAQFSVDTTGRTPQEIADEIIRGLGQ
jgi:shikimate kinase